MKGAALPYTSGSNGHNTMPTWVCFPHKIVLKKSSIVLSAFFLNEKEFFRIEQTLVHASGFPSEQLPAWTLIDECDNSTNSHTQVWPEQIKDFGAKTQKITISKHSFAKRDNSPSHHHHNEEEGMEIRKKKVSFRLLSVYFSVPVKFQNSTPRKSCFSHWDFMIVIFGVLAPKSLICSGQTCVWGPRTGVVTFIY